MQGFNQIVDERTESRRSWRSSGLGRVDGYQAHRPPCTLAEDAAGHPFGIKLGIGVSPALCQRNHRSPARPVRRRHHGHNIQLPRLPQPKARLYGTTFDLPDGSQEIFELTATTASTPPGAERVSRSASTKPTRRANFEAALNTSLQTFRRDQACFRICGGSGAMTSSFYDSARIRHSVIDGPPFDTAIALRDAYRGGHRCSGTKATTSPGSASYDTAIARVDDRS